MYLDEQELFDLRRSLETIRNIVRFLHRNEDEEENDTPYPSLKRLAGDIAVFPQLIGKIDGILNKYGKIKDNASTELARIRRELASTMGNISRSLNSILRSAQSEGYVDKDVAPTMRDGRLVIPVAPGLKRKIKGIVHDESASGKTVFIEPAEVVEANNRIRELEGDERREIIRILTEFSNILRPSIPEILQSYEFLAEIDFIRAKSYFAIQTNSLKPAVENEQLLDWTMAVHPLLQLSLAKHGKKVVPLDIELNQKQRILIISGPNAGGKSVCLKTVGLLQYMLQCGMLIPLHERSHAGIFSSIFIDIGDEQSIEQSLSTYSSHMKKLIYILEHATCRSLILIDEIGSGTDPQEGACLGEAILDTLLRRDCRIVASTHYGELKSYGQSRDDITLASVGFDVETMRPTYRLKLHSIGSSYAFEIAASLGLDHEIIDQALHNKEERMSEAEKLTEKLTKQSAELDEKEERINTLLADNEKLHNRYEHQLSVATKQKDRIVEEAQQEANKMLEEAKKTIDELTKDIMNQGALKPHQVTAAKHALDQQKYEKKEVVKVQDHVFKKGDHVKLDKMNREGDVLEVKKHELLVDLGGLQARVKDTDVTFMHGASKPQKVKKAGTRQHMKKTGHYEVNVIGMRYEEAMNIVEKFLDDALLLGYPSVRIVHGMGKGILRNGIRKKLDHLSYVKEYHDGGPNEGGLGVTVVSFE